jgi:hypothetical protein
VLAFYAQNTNFKLARVFEFLSNFQSFFKSNVTLTFVLEFGHCQFYIFIKFWFLSAINLCI